LFGPHLLCAQSSPLPDICLPCNLQLGGSGVLVQPMTYIFDEEPARWRQLLDKLGLDEGPPRR
jgi:hypothetical protein